MTVMPRRYHGHRFIRCRCHGYKQSLHQKSPCVVPSDSCALASKTHDYKLVAEALSGGNNAVSRIIGHACFKSCSIGVIVIAVRLDKLVRVVPVNVFA